MAFHSNKELEIILEHAKLEIEGVNQLDQWSTPPMTSREPIQDLIVFWSNETPIPNLKPKILK